MRSVIERIEIALRYMFLVVVCETDVSDEFSLREQEGRVWGVSLCILVYHLSKRGEIFDH